MAECVYRVVLDGRERECIAKGPDHTEHIYPRAQGRARFEFIPMAPPEESTDG